MKKVKRFILLGTTMFFFIVFVVAGSTTLMVNHFDKSTIVKTITCDANNHCTTQITEK